MESTNRPENHDLDDAQNKDLINFLVTLPKKKLQEELTRLEQLSQEDEKFGNNTLPANSNKTRNFIRDLLGL